MKWLLFAHDSSRRRSLQKCEKGRGLYNHNSGIGHSTIDLDHSIFAAIPTGTLKANAFFIGSALMH
jgi:hypothetical protein